MSTRPAPQALTLPLARTSGPVRIDGAQLFGGQREVLIVHNGEEYRLRITRQEKLILTK
jgi:hemin uptake protein HemP